MGIWAFQILRGSQVTREIVSKIEGMDLMMIL